MPLLALVLIAGGACSPGSSSHGRAAPRVARPPAAALPVRPGDPPQADYLVDRTLHLASRPEPVQLAIAPHPALQGTLAPLVVPSPDGTTLAYSTFNEDVELDPERTPSEQGVHPGDALGTPSILLHDLRTGTERTLAHGAYSPAWRRDGAIAYVQGTDAAYRAGTTYTGQVMVRANPGGRGGDDQAEQWTDSEGRYVVAGWAGARLLVYHTTGNESFDLEVLDGPGDVRTLAPASSLIALSPDGTRAAVATSANGWSSNVQILDIPSGEPVASLQTDAHTSLVYAGSWVGSRLVARGGDDRGPIVDVFAVGSDSVRLEKVLRVDPSLPVGLSEPKLDPEDPNRMTAWSYVPDRSESGPYVLVGCDLATLTCTAGPPIRAKVVRLYTATGP